MAFTDCASTQQTEIGEAFIGRHSCAPTRIAINDKNFEELCRAFQKLGARERERGRRGLRGTEKGNKSVRFDE